MAAEAATVAHTRSLHRQERGRSAIEFRAFGVCYRAKEMGGKVCDIIAAVDKWVVKYTGRIP